MIRVFIKASSPLARAGLESLLREQHDLRLVEEPLPEAHGAESPSTVLVVETGGLLDAVAQEAVQRASAGGLVILLVRNPAVEPVSDALRAGVKAVLASDADGREILAAVEAAAAGLVVLDVKSVEALLEPASAMSNRGAERLGETLTARELEVLRLVAAGLGNKEIASRLQISDHTVKFHVASIMGKLGAASRTEAVTLGIRHGLIMV
jgi:DNA-binding NarL/FixJ family response regulator